MSDIVPKIAQNLFDSLTQQKEPFGSFTVDPCEPKLPSEFNSELTVLFPKSSEKIIPAMGGSIVKLSLGNNAIDREDPKYNAYKNNIDAKSLAAFNNEKIKKFAKGNISEVRVAISELYSKSISNDISIPMIPSLYLSSTTSEFSTLDTTLDYFGVIRKNAKFAFIPSESIKTMLSLISSVLATGVENDIGGWSSISGNTLFETYALAKKETLLDDEAVKLIMDIFPFFNLSEEEMLEEKTKPNLGGYFTIIGSNIYLKMPDFSGADSAGYASSYFESSGLNFMFQLIVEQKDKSFSIKNIEIKTEVPIFASISTVSPEDYDLTSSTEPITITFEANAKPSAVYLSPAINDGPNIKNDILRGIYASQSSNFIEYSAYPNPFVNVIDGKITLKDIGYVDGVDDLYSYISKETINVIQNKLNTKYNFDRTIEPYINSFSSYDFKSGFPTYEEVFSLMTAPDGGSRRKPTLYEFVGGLSRQNIILHNGATYSEQIGSSGKKINNLKYFKQDFISNKVGLCENYRPRVYKTAVNFIPSSWIKSAEITVAGDGLYSVTFSKAEITNKFYSQSATRMKFVVYAYDGKTQISKFENGYIDISRGLPSIDSVKPDGTFGGVIINCNNEDNEITIETASAKSINKITIGKINILPPYKSVFPNSITLDPCQSISTGILDLIIYSGDLESDPYQIYISGPEITDPSQLPSLKQPTLLSEDQAIGISGKNTDQIPICYNDPRARIEIRSKKNIFKGRDIFAYLAFKDEDTVKKFSVHYVETTIRGTKVFVAKDFDYELSNSLFSDFYKKSNKTAQLFFPGEKHQTKPIGLLAGIDKAYIVISTKNGTEFSPSDQLGLIQLGSDTKKAFAASPLIIGIAAKYSDDTIVNHFNNFNKSDDYTEIADEILRMELSEDAIFGLPRPIIVMNKFKKLIVLFKYRELTKFKKKNFKLFIKNTLVGNIFSISSVKKASAISDDPKANDLYYIVVKDVNISTSEDAPVRIDIYDPDFFINNSTRDKFVDISIELGSSYIVPAADPTTSDSVFFAKDVLYPSDFVGNLFGDYTSELALSGFFADRNYSTSSTTGSSSIVFSHDSNRMYPGAEVSSNIATTILTNSIISAIQSNAANALATATNTANEAAAAAEAAIAKAKESGTSFDSTVAEAAIAASEAAALSAATAATSADSATASLSSNSLTLLKNTTSNEVSFLPNGNFIFSAGAEILSSEYLKGASQYLIFERLKVVDICKLAALTPVIVSINPTSTASPGERMTLVIQNLSPTFVIEIAGIEARVVSIAVDKFGVYTVTVIIPEGIPSIISIVDCGAKAYNGDQVLNFGINQLGKDMTTLLERQAAGVLSDITHQVDEFKNKLLVHPLRFISVIMDAANIAKDFMRTFCDFSFHLTANLSINLQGFSQLLVPVKVILCIIDVICNLLNPFQLPGAIIRLFECLYDLILLLPQISVPVMFLSILLHILDLLECVIVKVMGLITIINLFIDAITKIVESTESGFVDFRALMNLEELLLKYVISLEGDLEVMAPITQILAIFLQLLGLSFRFPCSVNPDSLIAPCGIDGFEIGGMVSGMIAEQTGSAPHIKYKFKKEYLIPICQPFTKTASETATAPSYSSPNVTVEPQRGAIVYDGTAATDGNIYDISYFNPNTLRKKDSSFDPTADDIEDITSDTYSALSASYTRRRKMFESSQSVIFEFNERTWESGLFPAFDKQVIDENKSFDTPITLLSKNTTNLNVANSASYGSFYSLMDGKEMMTAPIDNKASIKPLILDIVQEGVTITRTFDTIPAMLLLDEEFNVYVVEDNGIIFSEYKQLTGGVYSGGSVIGISQIRATVINRQSSTPDAFDKEDEVIGEDDAGNPVTKSIFSLPQLYFVDTRVAAESIQAKCQTSSLNQIPLDVTGDGGLASIETVKICIDDFLNSIRNQTGSIKESLSLGKAPKPMSPIEVDTAFSKLIDCTKKGIDDVCSIVVNPLNTSFQLLEDTDKTAILPDPSLSADILSGVAAAGPALTGAREYAAGIGDAETVFVGSQATVYIVPRDSYDNLITFDMSSKIKIDIISDSTESAVISPVPTDADPQNYLVYNSTTQSYTAKISASNSGEVKIKASICNKPIQALTYSDLIDTIPDAAGCVPDALSSINSADSIPLGALTRINRVLTITFIAPDATPIMAGATDSGIIITEPQLFGTGLEN
jgi:hypothetical protein